MDTLVAKTFWSRQISQIREEGWVAFKRKINTLTRPVIIFLFSFICIPLVLIIRFIKPWYWIRFGYFLGSRIGHFAFDVEYYLSERKVGLHPEKAIDVFFYRMGKPANAFLQK